jgi:hypothetical protein
MKLEKPDFFLIMPLLGSLLSSEYRLGLINWFSPTRGAIFSFILSPAEKLADWRRGGLMRVGPALWESGGGGGLRCEF